MIRLVIGTNVHISAPMFGGLPDSFLDLVFLQSFVTVISAVRSLGSLAKNTKTFELAVF